MSGKVAFVTPRYGPEIMGGAETAVRQLAEHLCALTDWEAEVHTTCASDAITWADELEPGTTEHQRGGGAPAPFGARPPARFLRARRHASAWPHAWPRGSRACGGSTTTVPSRRNSSTPSSRRTPTSSPSRRTCTTRPWRPSARCACRQCSTRPRTTSRPSTCRSSAARSATPTPSASTRRPSAPSSSGCTRWRSARRSCSASAWVTPRPPGGPAASSSGWGTVRTSSASDGSTSTRAPKCWPRSSRPTRNATPGRWPWPWSVRSRSSSPPHPDIVVTGAVSEPDKWDIVRDALVAVSPSALESFSLVVIEAWVERLPVLVNGSCGPTREHCRALGRRPVVHLVPRVRGGARPAGVRRRAARRLGSRGRVFVDRHFRWPVLVGRYDEFLTSVVERGRGTPGLF